MPQVNIKPFQVILKKLMAEEIQQHIKQAPKLKPVDEQILVLMSLNLHKLPLTPNQRVTVAPSKPKPKTIITKSSAKLSNKPNR